MNELFRLQPASRTARFVLCFITLGTASLFAADLPAGPATHPIRTTIHLRSAATARIALFERDDLPRARKLAQIETLREPREVDGWFLAMETASLLADEKTELRSALTVCKLATDNDPRAKIAAMRLTQLGRNSDTFSREQSAVATVSAGNSTCAPAAIEALYRAALDGLPGVDIRNLAQRSGWLTNWTISRANAPKTSAEQFEFADARIRLPYYLPQSAGYVAESDYLAPKAGDYLLSSNVAGSNLSIDGKAIDAEAIALDAGTHHIQIAFRAPESAPRLRIVLAQSPSALANFHLPPRETIYVHAALALADGQSADATQQLQNSDLAHTAIAQHLIADAQQKPPPISTDLLRRARLHIDANRHREAIAELTRIVHDWPLDREAHRLLISELQRAGNDCAADRAAAEFLAIAPNARNYRRMAQNAIATTEDSVAPFYQPYRRPAPAALAASSDASSPAVILLQDKVAITRLDGSVSVYMHRVVQLMNAAGAEQFQPLALPVGSQLLTARVVNTDRDLTSGVASGDEIEEEYVVNYTGDGGMLAHPEAFQYVFNDFDFAMLDARFVVLSPAAESLGYVIASGNIPPSRTEFMNGERAQIWEKKIESADAATDAPAIIRVVENENGWSIPPAVERRRILETIHPGPRPREA